MEDQPDICFGRWRLSLGSRRLLADGTPVALGGRAFDVLLALVEARGDIVTKEALMRRVWPGTIIEDNNLQVQISALRKVLGRDADLLITTVPRRGYCFTGKWQWQEAAPRPASAEDAPTTSADRPSPIVLPFHGLGAPTLALPDKPSIAVLPFRNMSGDPEQEYFCDGIVEEIITALSRFHSLFVIARNSSFTYKGRAVDVKLVGRELGARFVLEGSVRKAANRVRITDQLIDSLTGVHLWADRFEGSLEDIFKLQDHVTASVVGAIAPKLEKVEIERARRKPTEKLDAYDYFLRGMASHYQISSRDDNEEALRHFDRAIQLDPDFASAYAMAAHCYLWRKSSGWMSDPRHEITETARLARRALEFGNDDGMVLAASGSALALVAGDLDTGIALLDRALVLNPNLVMAWHWGGYAKIWLGEPDEGVERLAHAARLSPLDLRMPQIRSAVAHAHFMAARYDEASQWAAMALQDMPDLQPGLRISAASDALAGRLASAQKAVARLRQLNSALRVSSLRDVLGPYRRPEDVERYEEGLRRAGLPV
jgi:TolB-like protein/DNA-binding winged helix-turn-helix (wHTH) protein/Tfp pilus assembly protein PilF